MGTPGVIDGDTFNFTFGNTVIQVNLGSTPDTVAENALQVDGNGDEYLDLTGQGALKATITVYSEAAYDNVLGFYEMENAAGGVLAADGVTVL